MKTLLLSGLLLVATNVVEENLVRISPKAVSPNSQLEIFVLDDKKGPLSYAVVDNRLKKVLAKVASSYREATAGRSWALEQTQSAGIYWHPSGSLVAIDEENHHFMGTVHILAVNAGGNVSEIPLPDSGEMTPSISWDRYRIRVEPPGWTRDKELQLIIGGQAVVKDEPRTTESRMYDVVLEISEKAQVKSVKRMQD